ncbi:MAG: imelysin family protein [Pseudomonadota bacterium]
MSIALISRRVAVAAAFLVAGLFGASADEAKFEAALDKAIEAVIVPNHQSFAENAVGMVDPVQALCAAPSADALETARERFKSTTIAWSRVEMFRFGPAREENRFEKLFYWPDRKGRGLKQVQRILANEDETARTGQTLSGKSVAVQGLPALEFVLFGTGSDDLAGGAAYRCDYAIALTEVIAANAAALVAGWSEIGGYGDLMRTAGSATSPYRSHSEAVQDLIKAASEQLQIVGDMKVSAAIGDEVAKAKPRRSPFFRAQMTSATIVANLDAVEALFVSSINDLLPEDDARYAGTLSSELDQARKRLSGLDPDWETVAASEDGHASLRALRFPLGGAVRLASEVYPATLGLTLGFNSLDGD